MHAHKVLYVWILGVFLRTVIKMANSNLTPFKVWELIKIISRKFAAAIFGMRGVLVS